MKKETKPRDIKVSAKEPLNCPEEDEVNFSMLQEMHEDDVRDFANELTNIYFFEDVDVKKLDQEQLEGLIQEVVHKHQLSGRVLMRVWERLKKRQISQLVEW